MRKARDKKNGSGDRTYGWTDGAKIFQILASLRHDHDEEYILVES